MTETVITHPDNHEPTQFTLAMLELSLIHI